MPDSIITYDTLYELLRNEKYNTELQKISQDFFKDVTNYLAEKESILNKQKDSQFTSEIIKIKKQVENIKKILKEVYERRERKIIELALTNSRIKIKLKGLNLLKEEQEFFNELTSILNNYRDNILNNIITGKEPEIIKKPKEINTQNKQKLVRFLQPVPSFLSSNLEIFGPFGEEDIANLPEKEAEILIKNKKAEEIKNENTKSN